MLNKIRPTGRYFLRRIFVPVDSEETFLTSFRHEDLFDGVLAHAEGVDGGNPKLIHHTAA